MAQSVQVQKVNDWHESLIDYIVSNPSATLRQKSQVFGVSISWLSIVENSDSFKERLKQRRDEHFGNVSRGIVQKLEATADMVIEEINSRIERDASNAIPLATLRDVGSMALTHLGFGKKDDPRQSASVINNNTVIVNDKAALAEARAMMAKQREALSPVLENNVEADTPMIDVTPTKTNG